MCMHTRNLMPTRTISISEEAYRRLKALKREGESFSDVILRITSKSSVWGLVGVLPKDRVDEVEEAIADNRKRFREALSEHGRS